MEKIYIIILTILLITIIISIIYSHININISNYIIKDKRIDKDLVIVFLSDLHNRNLSNKLLSIIDNIKPDIILLGGDMVNDDRDDDNHFFELYHKLKGYKIYYTFGNHEERMNIEDKELLFKKLKKTNISLLNNKTEKLTNNISLLGLDNEIETYLKFGKKGLSESYIVDKLGKIDTKKYNILIAHNPLEFDSYVKYNASLVLSGHIHGGLARIPGFKGILSPDVTLFPKHDSGQYNSKNTKMIVSRGLGYSKRIPFRIFNPAEVVVINLKRNL